MGEKGYTFISYFTTYLLENLKEKEGTSISDFWQLERMKQLAAMLNYKNIDFGNWNNITKYLTPQQHGSNKNPLPLPTKLSTTT